jgi:hypothetical protein
MTEEEARAQAAQMFKPQFDYLAGLENQAKANAGQSDTKLAQLYAALQQGYKADAAPVGANYDNTGKALATTYDAGVQQIGKAQDDTAARTAAMMKKLGIEEAGGELFKENVQDTQAAQQRLISQKTVDLAGNTSTRGAAMDDLIVKGQAAGLQGADKRSALQSQLLNILAGYGGKKAELSSEQAKASFDILSNSQKQRQDAMEQFMQQQQRNFMNEDVLHDNRLADDKFAYDQQHDGEQPSPQAKLSPFEQFSQAAAEGYGALGRPFGTDNGIKAITDAARYYANAHGGNTPKTAQDFINYVRERNPQAKGDLRLLMDLAARYYDFAY